MQWVRVFFFFFFFSFSSFTCTHTHTAFPYCITLQVPTPRHRRCHCADSRFRHTHTHMCVCWSQQKQLQWFRYLINMILILKKDRITVFFRRSSWLMTLIMSVKLIRIISPICHWNARNLSSNVLIFQKESTFALFCLMMSMK